MVTNKKSGMGLVEVVIGTTIIVIGILTLINAFTTYLKFALANDKNIQAAYLEEEGLEAVSYLRDYSWTAKIQTLSTTTTYYLYWDSALSMWTTTTTPQYVDGVFLRKINISDVKRDANDKIAATGTYDPNTKKASSTVLYYQGHATTTQSMTTYISNLYGN